jgi:D-glycero-D-manno-heptose 1,7-bisphosphate phosphatase
MYPVRFIALDRDGVINEDSDDYIKSAAEWRPISGSIEAITRLTSAGFRIAVVTNQSGLARGLFDPGTLNEIHGRMRTLLERAGGRIEMILFCPHKPGTGCRCRKPESGLFEQLADRLGFALAGLPFIGDSMGDVEAATRVGMTPILVKTGKGQKTLAENPMRLTGVTIYESLADAADELIEQWKNF